MRRLATREPKPANRSRRCSTRCRAGRSLLDPRRAWPARFRSGRSPSETREADSTRSARPKTAPPAQRLLRRTARPRPHRACRAAPPFCVAGTTPTDEAQPALAPQTEARAALDRSAPAKPSTQVALGRTQPAGPACATEVSPARQCRAASRPSARTADPVKRLAVSFSMHTSVRELAVLTCPVTSLRARRPKTPRSTRLAIRRWRARASPSRPGRIPTCSAPRARQPPATSRSTEAVRVPGAGTHRWPPRAVALPKEPDSGSPSGRSRLARPASARPDCKQPSPALAGQTSVLASPPTHPSSVLSEDRSLDRYRRPKTTAAGTAELIRTRSDRLCDANPSARNRHPLDRSLAVPERRNAPEDCRDPSNTRRHPTRDQHPAEARCRNRPAFDSAASSTASRWPVRPVVTNTHMRVRMHEPEQRKLSSVRTARARSESDRLAPVDRRRLPEVRCLSAESGISIVTRRFTSPTPSALSVSHALSGLIPIHPRGLVSCHIHS